MEEDIKGAAIVILAVIVIVALLFSAPIISGIKFYKDVGNLEEKWMEFQCPVSTGFETIYGEYYFVKCPEFYELWRNERYGGRKIKMILLHDHKFFQTILVHTDWAGSQYQRREFKIEEGTIFVKMRYVP